jgi:Flp pilus assembly protein TadB
MNTLLVFGLAVACGLVVLFFFFGVARIASRRDENKQLIEIINGINTTEVGLQRSDAGLPDPKTWSGYWYDLANRSGTKFDNPSTPGIMAMGLPLFAFGVGFFVYPGDLFGGAIGAFLALFLMQTIFKGKIRGRLILMEKQLPNLLSGIRANLKAQLTPQQAIINQSKEIGYPLGEELKTMTNEMALGITLDQALQNFSHRIPSRDIQFLASSIRIAIASGADLDPLVETIQRIIVQRTRIANHLVAAVAKVQPAIWVTGVMIPAGFAYSFYSDEKNRDFWLSAPTGLIAMLIVGFAYALGLFIAKKQVDKVKKA